MSFCQSTDIRDFYFYFWLKKNKKYILKNKKDNKTKSKAKKRKTNEKKEAIGKKKFFLSALGHHTATTSKAHW